MYTRLSRRIRLSIIAAMTVLLLATLALTSMENLLPSLIGGVVAGLLISEVSIYLQRKAE